VGFDQIMQGGGLLTQDFGQTSYALSCRCEWTCPGYAPGAFHAGIDIAPPPPGGNPVLLAVGYGQCVRVGRVLQGYSCSGLGPNAPCIRSGNLDFWYGHALRSLVNPGDFVVPGQPIAICDSIGCSTGNHVHYEVLPAGQDPNGCNAISPWAYLNAWPGAPTLQPCPPGLVGVPPNCSWPRDQRAGGGGVALLALAGVALVLAARSGGSK
jgi:murein DD-endopeptidase MepM/ murein hydrolase activator NlpD